MKALFTLITWVAAPVAAFSQSQGSIRHFSHTVTTVASTDKIWSIWTDVAQWPVWDTGLQNATLPGDFGKGATGELVSIEGRKASFQILEIAEGSSYTFKTKLPLGGLHITRRLRQNGAITEFTHEVEFKGITSPIFALMLGKKYRKLLPEAMEKIKKLAEQ